MLDSDKKQFQEMILATAELYSTAKKIEVTPVMMKLFFSALHNFSIEQVSYGFEKHLSDPVDGRFFPKPANISKHLQTTVLSVSEKAELAWAQVMGEISRIGSYGSLNLEDKQAMAAVKALGTWKDLCATDITKMDFKKREFLAVYKTYENTPIDMLPNKLPGRLEIEQHKQESAQSIKQIMTGIQNKRLESE